MPLVQLSVHLINDLHSMLDSTA